MSRRSCLRCQTTYVGSLALCARCRKEVIDDYLAGPPAVAEMLTVIEAARAVVSTSSTVPTATHRELAAALDALDDARTEDGEETRPETPSAREARIHPRVSKAARAGYQSLTPRIVAADAAGLVAFLREVFGAAGELQGDRPAELCVGDSLVMVTSAGAREPFPAFLYVYVDDADATYRRALDAGATSLEAPLETPYGDRRAMVRDRWGNVWQIAHVMRSPEQQGGQQA